MGRVDRVGQKVDGWVGDEQEEYLDVSARTVLDAMASSTCNQPRTHPHAPFTCTTTPFAPRLLTMQFHPTTTQASV